MTIVILLNDWIFNLIFAHNEFDLNVAANIEYITYDQRFRLAY